MIKRNLAVFNKKTTWYLVPNISHFRPKSPITQYDISKTIPKKSTLTVPGTASHNDKNNFNRP